MKRLHHRPPATAGLGLLLATLAALTALPSGLAGAAELADKVTKDCGGCHDLTGPSDDSLAARSERQAPPLYYAGNKFREDWVVSWLQKPSRIRPAGDFPPAHVRTTAEGDVIDASGLIDHPVLPAAEAEAVGGYLMTLRPHDDLIAQEDYTPGKVSLRMGAMDFVKFKGCAACHRDTPKLGGLSGPELHTAWQRLQPEFITSYIRDPAAWEPRSLMPNQHLESGPIHKLANYLRAIGESSEESK
ncbi:MAG: hypothetical protein Tsb0032_11470 [Kiloniellaceae bacterium]